MSDITEGLGTAVEGGLFARAMEPGSGAKERRPDDPETCLNCGTPLLGAYCHACGQTAHIHRTIGAFMHDLLHGALHFEGKLWRTLPMLVFRPGQLTRRYVEGARARFVSPMALFLFSVFLMFAVFQMVGITAPTDIAQDEGDGRASLSEEFAIGETNDEGAARLADAIDGAQQGFAQAMEEEGVAVPVDENGDARLTLNTTGLDWLDATVEKWRENPELMLYKLQANSYKFSWLLIPISIPFVWLLFAWKRRFRGYDHAIFVTYSLSFMTLLLVTLSVLDAIGVTAAVTVPALFLVPPIHLYKQLRHAYELSRFSAFWRLLVLSAFIWAILLIFLQVLIVLGGL
jgi:hypothetical protein